MTPTSIGGCIVAFVASEAQLLAISAIAARLLLATGHPYILKMA
jgi:hypothetical protein